MDIITLFKYAMGNNIYCQYLSAYYVSYVTLGPLNKLSHLVFTNLTQDYPKFRDDNARSERLGDTSKGVQLLSSHAWIPS